MLRVALLGVGALLLGPAPMEAPKAPEHVQKIVQEIKLGQAGGRLGVRLDEVASDDVDELKLAEERGARVVEVVEDSPAAEAGLRVDDVVVGFQGQRIESAAQLARLVRETPPGRKVKLDVSRDGRSVTLTPTLGSAHAAFQWLQRWDGDATPVIPEMPDMSEMPGVPPVPPVPHGMSPHHPWPTVPMPWMEWARRPRKLGITYQEISGQLADYFRAKGETAVLVTSVEDDGPAAAAGIKAGDLIVQLGETAVTDGESLMEALDDAEPSAQVGVTVQRDGKAVQLEVVMGGEKGRRRHPMSPPNRT